MATLPKGIAERLAFFEQHAPVWAASPAAIGLTAAQVTALASLVNTARTAFNAAQNARSASRAATVSQTDAMGSLSDYGADLIKTIRAFAETTKDPSVYSKAQIPPPAAPSPVGPPEMPTELAASFLFPWGVRLTWKGSVSQGAYFGVFRRLRGETQFTFLQITKDRFFDDTGLPAGATGADYYIAAFREQHQVNAPPIALQFAPGADGSTTVTSLGLAA